MCSVPYLPELAFICARTTAGDSDWNPLADLNFDNKINVIDVALAAKNFGKTYR